jgi:hypothetical protein
MSRTGLVRVRARDHHKIGSLGGGRSLLTAIETTFAPSLAGETEASLALKRPGDERRDVGPAVERSRIAVVVRES